MFHASSLAMQGTSSEFERRRGVHVGKQPFGKCIKRRLHSLTDKEQAFCYQFLPGDISITPCLASVAEDGS